MRGKEGGRGRGGVSGGSAKSRRSAGGGRIPPRGPKYQGLPRRGDPLGQGIYTAPVTRKEGPEEGGERDGRRRREERGTGR